MSYVPQTFCYFPILEEEYEAYYESCDYRIGDGSVVGAGCLRRPEQFAGSRDRRAGFPNAPKTTSVMAEPDHWVRR